jgi:catechol 2,3-dioxygenase-like lactoylglutathione lyase family enzyme
MTRDVSGVLDGPIRQIGYIVRDLDAAIDSWLALGIGPWFTIRELTQKDCSYRGELCEPTLSIAFANSGAMQIELIQQIDDAPSIYREFLDAGAEGYHQLAWWVTDFDAIQQKANDAGWSVVFSGGGDGAVRFAYFEPDSKVSTIVEVMELNDSSRGMGELVAGAAAEWDGVTDPIRALF